MAPGKPNQMRRLKGNLVLNPDDLTAAYPYGGTELGMCRSATFVFGISYTPIQAEEFGGIVSEYVFTGESAVLSAVLREYDDDMVATVFHSGIEGENDDTSKNTKSGKPVIKGAVGAGVGGTGQVTAGQSINSRAVRVLFVPDDRDNHEFLVLYTAIPMVHEATEMKLTASDWAEIGVVFHAIPDAAGKLYQFGRKSDIAIV